MTDVYTGEGWVEIEDLETVTLGHHICCDCPAPANHLTDPGVDWPGLFWAQCDNCASETLSGG